MNALASLDRQTKRHTLTRNLHGKSVSADASEIESHTLHSHPLVGQAHSQDALHLYSAILLPLDLHSRSLEGYRQLQPWRVFIFIAPVSSEENLIQRKSTGTVVLNIKILGFS